MNKFQKLFLNPLLIEIKKFNEKNHSKFETLKQYIFNTSIEKLDFEKEEFFKINCIINKTTKKFDIESIMKIKNKKVCYNKKIFKNELLYELNEILKITNSKIEEIMNIFFKTALENFENIEIFNFLVNLKNDNDFDVLITLID